MTVLLNTLGLREVQAKLMAGECSSAELVAACLKRIDEREPAIRAWAWVDAEHALQQAVQYAERLPSARYPLAGIPIGIKDVIDTARMPTSYGSPIYAGHQPAWDAYCVAAIQNAGGIILGKTTTAEFAHSAPPPTHNPRAIGHTPGGSSSGSAASVADFMVPASIATQTGGSTIRPAAFCGIVGYKPSFGAINRSGVKPVAESLDTVGLMARSVADIELLASVLMPHTTVAMPAVAPRIGFYQTPEWHQLGPEAQDVILARLQCLAQHGATVSVVSDMQALDPLGKDQRDIMNYEAARALLHEYIHHPAQLSDDMHASIEQGLAYPAEDYARARQRAQHARRTFKQQLQAYDVIVTPSAPGSAPEGIASSGTSLFNRRWSVLGVPALTLPNGTSAPKHLPLGIQLIGHMGHDAQLLHWAQWIEARSLS